MKHAMIKILGTLLILSVTAPSFAQNNHFVMMGGGGEPKRDYTIFDNEVERVGNFISTTPTWNTKITFNGGHQKTENIIAEKFGRKGVSNTPFTPDSYQKMIKEYAAKIRRGEIKSGDQLMILINTHGGQKTDAHKTHSLATTDGVVTDYDKLNKGTVSMDALEEITKLASEKNIKLALIDFSCHSGNTMALQNPNTCVITSTGPDHYGWGGNNVTFTSIFAGNMKKGKSLEDVYLESRKSFKDNSFPMISSPVGLELHQEMYKSITPFLYHWDDSHDKLSPFLEKEVLSENPYCIGGEGVELLKKLSEEAERFSDLSLRSIVGDKNLQAFNQSVVAYHAHLKNLHGKLSSLGLDILKKKEQFCTEFQLTKNTKSKECVTYPYENLFSINFENIIEYFEEQVQKSKGDERKRYQAIIQNTKNGNKRKAELIAKYPELSNYKNFYKNQPNLEKETYKLAFDVSKESQKLYYALYKQRALREKKPNPCKDFVL